MFGVEVSNRLLVVVGALGRAEEGFRGGGAGGGEDWR